MKDNIVGLIGMAIPGGFTFYTIIEDMMPVLQFLGLLVTIAIGVTILIINRKKIQKLNRDKKIDDIIFKHPNNN